MRYATSCIQRITAGIVTLATIVGCGTQRADYLAPAIAPAVLHATAFRDTPSDAVVMFLEREKDTTLSAYLTVNVDDRMRYLEDFAWDPDRTFASTWPGAVRRADDDSVLAYVKEVAQHATTDDKAFLVAYAEEDILRGSLEQWIRGESIKIVRFNKADLRPQ